MQKYLFLIPFILISLTARADWSAKIHIEANQKGAPTQSMGTMLFNGKKMRLDLTTPAQFTMIGDLATHKAWVLIPQAKMFMETGLSESDMKNVPLCNSKDIEPCLVKAGYKKTGRDSANGYSCSVYEAELKPPAVKVSTHAKLWRADGIKEMGVTRVLTTEAGSDTKVQVDLTDIKVVPIPNTLFVLPKDYSPMPDVQGLLKGAGH